MVYKYMEMYYDWLYWLIDTFIIKPKEDTWDLVADLFDGTRND